MTKSRWQGRAEAGSDTHHSCCKDVVSHVARSLPAPCTLGPNLGLYLAAGACNLTTSPFLQPPRCHTRRFFQPACLHPSQAVLLLLSTTDTHHTSPWLGACPRHAGASLLPKTSSSSNRTASLGLSDTVTAAKALLLGQHHPTRKTGAGLPALWHRSLCNTHAFAIPMPWPTCPLTLQNHSKFRTVWAHC